MLWADEAGRTRRPVVAIEDHLYHTGELLDAVAAIAPERLSQLTVCALDRPGPDTQAAVAEWSARYPETNIITLDHIGGLKPADYGRTPLKPADYGGFAREIARLLRPGGIVLQDIQLETLPFIPADRWWESIYLGATIRGLFPERPPVIRFCSNKRGYDATFGRELLDAGFDPRDVLDKTEMSRVVVPALLKLLQSQFPQALRTNGSAESRAIPVADADRSEVERDSDVVLWRTPAGATIGGRAVGGTTALKAGSPEIQTWQTLMEDRFAAGEGVAVLDVGQRLAEPGAERAEHTNLAARHIHGLRARMKKPDAIITANHRYRLADELVVALV